MRWTRLALGKLMVNPDFREATFNVETSEELYVLFRNAP